MPESAKMLYIVLLLATLIGGATVTPDDVGSGGPLGHPATYDVGSGGPL